MSITLSVAVRCIYRSPVLTFNVQRLLGINKYYTCF